jgi:uncharacterized protein YggT (Ycf19 family)
MARRRLWRREERPLIEPRTRYARVDDEYVPGDGYVEDDVVDPEDDATVETHRTVVWASPRAMVDGVLWLLLGVLELLLAVRFLLIAFGARQTGFVQFIMDITSPIVRPFRDTFTVRAWDQGVLDYNVLLAMGVWFIVGVLVILLVNVVIPPMRDEYRMDHRRRIVNS